VLRLGILPTHDVIGKFVIRYEHCYPFISSSTSMAAFDGLTFVQSGSVPGSRLIVSNSNDLLQGIKLHF
jgi:hypothetical protein